MHNVAVIGSGNVGANTAFFIAEKGITDVALYDLREGIAAGKSLDMMEAAPIRKYRNRIRPAESLEVIGESETVILAAGAVRAPGMKREDLFAENRPLIAELAPEIGRLAPRATILIATEPVDLITTEFVKLSGLDRNRIMGIGGCLDVTRLRYFASQELGLSPENISATVIGRHSDGMIAILRYCSVSGLPLTSLLSEEQQDRIVEQTRRAGDLIVAMAQRSSAFYAPSAAIADLVDAIHMDLRRVSCVSLLFQGEYGISGVAMSLPAVIGRDGIERVLTPKLNDEELRRLRSSAAELEEILQSGGDQ
ncbi:MAG: malate dehydrogenase [Spirochaetales bacterium]|nr:malate dehydrogenase [Spirochaetales bacterium]